MVSFIDICIQIGRYVLPIALWISVFALIKYYISQSGWSTGSKVALFWFLAITSLFFLILYHVRCRAAAHREKNDLHSAESTTTVNLVL